MTGLRVARTSTPIKVYIIRQGPDGPVFEGFTYAGSGVMKERWAQPGGMLHPACFPTVRAAADTMKELTDRGVKPLHLSELKEP